MGVIESAPFQKRRTNAAVPQPPQRQAESEA